MKAFTLLPIAHPEGLLSPFSVICCLSATPTQCLVSCFHLFNHAETWGSATPLKGMVLLLPRLQPFLCSWVKCPMYCLQLRYRHHATGNIFVAGSHNSWLGAFFRVSIRRVKEQAIGLHRTQFPSNGIFRNACSSHAFSSGYPPFLQLSLLLNGPCLCIHSPTQLSDYQSILLFPPILPGHTPSHELHPSSWQPPSFCRTISLPPSMFPVKSKQISLPLCLTVPSTYQPTPSLFLFSYLRSSHSTVSSQMIPTIFIHCSTPYPSKLP